MNKQVKQAAVQKFAKLHAAGASAEEVKKAISENFKKDEIDEIYAAILAEEPEEEEKEVVVEEKKKEVNPNELKKFKKYAAAPVYKYRIDENTGEKERYLDRVEKKGDLISIHMIAQRHADELNAQIENSGFYYFA